jgi:hypothetical protein
MTLVFFEAATERVTILFPTDTDDEHTDATYIHESVHAELAGSTIAGCLDQALSQVICQLPSDDRRRLHLERVLTHRMDSSFQIHEAIATYAGLRRIGLKDVQAAYSLLARLPKDYKRAVDFYRWSRVQS